MSIYMYPECITYIKIPVVSHQFIFWNKLDVENHKINTTFIFLKLFWFAVF